MATAHQLLKQYEIQFDKDLAAGNIRNFIYPWDTIGEAIVLLYLLIPIQSTSFRRYGAIFAWTFNFLFSIYVIRYCRCRSMAPAFGLGLIKAWSILWTSTMILVYDCKTDFRRIETVNRPKDKGNPKGNPNGRPASQISTAIEQSSPLELRQRYPESPRQHSQTSDNHPSESNTQHHGRLAWRPYPTSSLLQRIDWVLDLYTNFRGMTWNWRISGPPPLPDWVQDELAGRSLSHPARERFVVGRDSTTMYLNLRDLLVARAKTFVIGYFTADALKTLMMHDPYFLLGDHTLSAPGFLPYVIRSSPFLVQSYRLLVTMTMMYTALHTVFDLAPLFFAGLLGPKVIGVRGEPWVYPDTYGSFFIILEKGLAGWWGGWWHQTFRFAFESVAKHISRELGYKPSSLFAKAVQLVVAFSLSGCLHGCGSFTQLGRTFPLRGAFFFFLLQSLGIILQMSFWNGLKRLGVVERTPKVLRQTMNFVFAHAWLYFTAPLICDDFARGGIWLFEPVPISPLRGLGFGVKGTGWWCWQGFPWLHWHQGKHWWQTGLVL